MLDSIDVSFSASVASAIVCLQPGHDRDEVVSGELRANEVQTRQPPGLPDVLATRFICVPRQQLQSGNVVITLGTGLLTPMFGPLTPTS